MFWELKQKEKDQGDEEMDVGDIVGSGIDI